MVQTINTAELVELLANQQVDLVDVRDHQEWQSGHIPGSRVIPLEVFRADPDAAISHGSIIVFVCAKGIRSMTAAKLAERFGYANIYNLEGGSKEWASAGLPLVVLERVAA